MAKAETAFAIYIHWPFCAAKCPYCDFNSHVRNTVDHDLWRNSLQTDLRAQAGLTDKCPVTSIFFGGGTPSLMDPMTVGGLIDEVDRIWGTDPALEVTLEANPTSVEAAKFRAFRHAGVNRVSMGIQALNDVDLKALGRMHTAREALAAFDVARNAFDRVSFDLIYARQNQSLTDWEGELRQAIALSVDHLSLYQLTIEAGTRFGDLYARGRLRGLPNDGLGADLYDATQEICDAAGLSAYEISNHARSGSESLHNLTYWRYQPYIGVGPGAHGRPMKAGQRHETSSYLNPEQWLEAVTTSGHGIKEIAALSPEDAGTEFMLMGMRLSEGVSLRTFQEISGKEIPRRVIETLISDAYIWERKGRIGATPNGRRVLNAILGELLSDE